MQILKIVTVLVALLPTLMLTNVSMAAQPDNLEPLEQVQPPPKVVDGEALDDPAIEPQITIRKKGADND